ncbi:MAG: LysR family transcriptional regulator [Pseudomonadota bacterium]
MRPQDLNLLVVFDAIMTEGSVTRAADRLAMTQPAVSNAVARMRHAWRDELFVKDGRNIQPTLAAKSLWQQVQEPLRHLGEAIEPNQFDPRTSTRTFRVCSTDGVIDLAWPQLRRAIEEEAPGVAVHAVPWNMNEGDQTLIDGAVDLVMAVTSLMPPNDAVDSLYLYDTPYKVALRPGHPLAKPDMTLEEFADADHLLVSLTGDTVGFTDRVLSQRGLKRRIAMTVNHFYGLAPILAESDLIAVVPTVTIEPAVIGGQVVLVDSPVLVSSSSLASFWHRRQARDPGLHWLRGHVETQLRQRSVQHQQFLQDHVLR